MAPDIHALQTPGFWSQAWEQVRKASPHIKRKIRSDNETMEFWNRIAPAYGKQTSGRSKERVLKIIELLGREKILTPQAAILDVGCGPGTYALPFAEQVTSVTALDGAGEMCKILKQRAKTKRLHNINVLHHLWKESIDRAIERLTHSFWLYTEITPDIRNTVTQFVSERAVDEIFRETVENHLGIMIWKVNQ